MIYKQIWKKCVIDPIDSLRHQNFSRNIFIHLLDIERKIRIAVEDHEISYHQKDPTLNLHPNNMRKKKKN